MKFSQTLVLNANPDWEGHYLDYAGLKKMINEWSNHAQAQQEKGGLLLEQDPSVAFLQTLEAAMIRIRDFYDDKRDEMDHALIELQEVLQPTTEETASVDSLRDLARQPSWQDRIITPIDEYDNETTPIMAAARPKIVSLRSSTDLSSTELNQIRGQICQLYTNYHNLHLYATLNATAVGKILKKYDKLMHANLKKNHLDRLVQSNFPFARDEPFNDQMETLKRYFAHLFCGNDVEEAEQQMKLMLREYVTFQRHSIWLDVIKDGRKRDAVQASAAAPSSTGKEKHTTLNSLQTSTSLPSGIMCVVAFVGLLLAPGIFDDEPEKRNALAMFVFVSLLWAAEVLPLFVTSMLVPFLAVILRVIVVGGERLSARDASDYVFSAMFSHVIMLLLGGFSIAAALSKYNVAKIAASSITRHCGNGIRAVLLLQMSIATIASMWISNVAAPVLCYSLIAPILKAASAEQSRASFGASQWQAANADRRLSRALVMGIALASNVGGMASPISTPQNLFALQYTTIGWIPWFTVSIPLCIVLNLVIWLWLIHCFELPSADSPAVAWALQRDRSSSEHMTLEHYFVISVSVGVVLLWCASMELSQWTGDMGVLGIVPFALFFGTGILSKDDLNNFLWSVVVLAMGGLVLGEVVTTSGLLEEIAGSIAHFIEENSLTLWATLSIFTALILFCTTFVSHTVGAIVVLPIAAAVGSDMSPSSHSKELVFAGALACSAAMGLPVSGFPNMTAVAQEDNLGNRFLTTRDFLRFALPASILSWMIIVTFGYGLIWFVASWDAVTNDK